MGHSKMHQSLTPMGAAIHNVKNHVLTKGMSNFAQCINEELETLFREPMHLGVVGRSCQRKCHFIGTLTQQMDREALGAAYNSLHGIYGIYPTSYPVGCYGRNYILRKQGKRLLHSSSVGDGLYSKVKDTWCRSDSVDDVGLGNLGSPPLVKDGILRKSSRAKMVQKWARLSLQEPVWESYQPQESFIEEESRSKAHRSMSSDEGVFVNEDETEKSEPQWNKSNNTIFPDPETISNPSIHQDIHQSFPNFISNLHIHDTETIHKEIYNYTPDEIQGLSLTYDAFVVFNCNRYVNSTTMRTLQTLHNFPLVYVNAAMDMCSSNKIEGARRLSMVCADTYRITRNYFRQKLFKYHIWDVPMFIISTRDPELFDFPDLLKNLTRIQKRKLKHQREFLVKVAMQTVIQIQKKFHWQTQMISITSAICAAENNFIYPFIPISHDILYKLHQHYISRSLFGLTNAQGQLNITKLEQPKSPKLIISQFPCLSVWVLHRLVQKLTSWIVDVSYSSTVLVGLASMAGYFITMKASDIYTKTCLIQSKRVITSISKSRIPVHLRTSPSTMSSRATSRVTSRSGSPIPSGRTTPASFE